MLRPMLKSWLDDNLPGLVERLVRAEIERVSRGRDWRNAAPPRRWQTNGFIPPAPISDRSRASLTRASVAKKKSRLKMMDCRVKPGNDSADRSRSNTLGIIIY